jgi:hypothetical protein
LEHAADRAEKRYNLGSTFWPPQIAGWSCFYVLTFVSILPPSSSRERFAAAVQKNELLRLIPVRITEEFDKKACHDPSVGRSFVVDSSPRKNRDENPLKGLSTKHRRYTHRPAQPILKERNGLLSQLRIASFQGHADRMTRTG